MWGRIGVREPVFHGSQQPWLQCVGQSRRRDAKDIVGAGVAYGAAQRTTSLEIELAFQRSDSNALGAFDSRYFRAFGGGDDNAVRHAFCKCFECLVKDKVAVVVDKEYGLH